MTKIDELMALARKYCRVWAGYGNDAEEKENYAEDALRTAIGRALDQARLEGYECGKEQTEPAPDVQPVAWTTMPDADDWLFLGDSKDPNGSLLGKWNPLYLHPSPAQTPLLASDIVTMYAESPTSDADMIEFARAIEAAHGIGAKP